MNEMIIEKNVPISPNIKRTGRKKIYPFGEMEVGDSVYIEQKRNKYGYFNAQSSAGEYGRRHNCKFTSRPESNGVRIWRIK